MAQISTIGNGKYSATFNNRSLLITVKRSGATAVDAETGEIIEGTELKSIKSLLKWHVESKLKDSELPTLWTMRDRQLRKSRT